MLADQPGHALCGLVGHAKLPLQFLGADTVARGCEKVDGVGPKLQRRAGLFERRADRWVQVMTAPLARVGALCLDPIPVRLAGAGGASEALLEADFEQVRQAGFVIRELLEELRGGELLCHAPSYAAVELLMKKGQTPIFQA